MDRPVASPPGTAEVLEGGLREPRLSPRGRRLAAVAAVLVLLAGAGVRLAEERLRERDERLVADCRAALDAADRRVLATVGFMVAHVEPALYAVGSGPRRRGLVELVAGAAGRARPVVEDALAVCERGSVAGWHGDLADRHGDYRGYLRARLRWLRLIAADGEEYYRDRPWLAAAREAAFGD